MTSKKENPLCVPEGTKTQRQNFSWEEQEFNLNIACLTLKAEKYC